MSLTYNVDPAIELIEHRFRNGHGPDELAYLRSHAYFNQLAPADACLRCLLAYELDASAKRAVGGDGNTTIGSIVGPQQEVAEPLRRAVATTIASSYLTMLSTEDPPGSDWVPGRDPEGLWRFWMRHLRSTATLAFDLPARLVASIEREGGGHLDSEIKRLGLGPGFLRRKALSNRCAEIARFGLILRMGQTSRCSDAVFDRSRDNGAAVRPLLT